MFKLPGVPTARADARELADYAEYMAWQNGSVSTTALSRVRGRLEENDYYDGVPEEDETDREVEDASIEMEARGHACGHDDIGYPFLIGTRGDTFALRSKVLNCRQLVYLYLLLVTRLNMRDYRRHAGIDGACLFEKLCADVAKTYIGARAECMVFGTASEIGSFREKINSLCRRLDEGSGARDVVSSSAKDGKMDVVAWKPFTDSWPGKLIIFGQCKTGTNYKDTLPQLQTDAFCRKWLQDMPAVIPMRAFFISEALSRSGGSSRHQWYESSVDAGLLFDRCRIVDFGDSIADDVLDEVRRWTKAAARANGLPDPCG